ncbi:MFS transporter [Cellulomonas sp. P24]|uniref:MFS transporter n=1 Tax=Cellulomonas sp. P24 TaxID=2885206 RepID=UPI00216B52CE|nr:MFS transporter [Cellulomonas sp. P24]MCR6494488.1 MFS transporter [Cellulomonas sp. P24]
MSSRTTPSASPASATTDPSGPPSPSRAAPTPVGAARSAVRGGVLGNYVDQFDIFLPVIALAPAAAHLYGPGDLTAAIGLVFVATLIGRPLGSAIFGPVADRVGRAATTKVTMAGVAVTTALVALVPGREILGPATFYAILGLRFLSGVFIGGGYTSAVPLAIEWTPERRRGLVSGLIMWMSPWANATIAALVLLMLNLLGPQTYSTWGWRIPFAMGAAMALAMLVFYHLHVTDNPDAAPSARASRPLSLVLVGHNGRSLRHLLVLMTGLWLFTDMAVAVLTGQLKTVAHLSDQHVTLTMLCATAASALAMVACGHLSTFTGRRTFFITFGVISAVLAPLTYLAIFRQHTPSSLVLLVVLLEVTTVSVYGPVAAYLTEHFPPAVRSSGYGLTYSMSIVAPALYPYYLPVLQHALGTEPAVAALLTLAGILTALGAAGASRSPRPNKQAPTAMPPEIGSLTLRHPQEQP